jgi:probable HAF family extracellular repeat protein
MRKAALLLVAVSHPAVAVAVSYTAVDLGTLGGTSARAIRVNDANQIIGVSRTAANEEHAFLWQNGVMIDLGTLGGTQSFPTAINAAGQVVGTSTLAGDVVTHAFLWESGMMIDLGTLGGTISWGNAINASGQIVGASSLTGDTEYHAFLWENGTMTDLGAIDHGPFSEAVAINATGQVVGAGTLPGFIASHGFLWDNGVMTDLGTNYPVAINAAGQVVGTSEGGGGAHAFLWEGGTLTDLGTLDGGTTSSAFNINDIGQVTGLSFTLGDAERHAFLWDNGTMIDLGTLGGGYSSGRAINELGQVAGGSRPPLPSDEHAFLWEGGVMTDVGGGAPQDFSQVFDINENGYLVGRAEPFTGGGNRAMLWLPTPGRLWVGLKNSDDQGTRFDLRTSLYLNGTLIAEGTARCIAGITRNPAAAKEVRVPLSSIPEDETLDPGDELALKVFTRIGTNPDDSKCPGHSNAVGLRLYYDAASRASQLGAKIAPLSQTDYYLHSTGGSFFLDTTPPTSSAKQKDSGPVKFAGGNPWVAIGTWTYTVP